MGCEIYYQPTDFKRAEDGGLVLYRGGPYEARRGVDVKVDGDRTFAVGGGEAEGAEGAVAGAAEGSIIRIVEQEGSTVHFAFKGANGEIQVMTEMTKEGDTLVLSGTHIQGAGAGTSSISELRAAARELGKSQGAKEVVIRGGERTSGANPGRMPREIRIKVD